MSEISLPQGHHSVKDVIQTCRFAIRCRGEYYAVCNIFQHDQFGGRSVMVLGGIPLEGRANLYRLDYDHLTAIRYWDENLGPIVRTYADTAVPGFFLVRNDA